MSKLDMLNQMSEGFEGYIFIGSLIKGNFSSKIQKVNSSKDLLPSEIATYDIYVVTAIDGVNVRSGIPSKEKYLKETYSKIPIKFHLKQGEMIVILGEPEKLSNTDFLCYIGSNKHWLFQFYGDRYEAMDYMRLIDRPDV